jgi:hypothetical protein
MFDKFITITFYHNFLNIINLRSNLESHLISSFFNVAANKISYLGSY